MRPVKPAYAAITRDVLLLSPRLLGAGCRILFDQAVGKSASRLQVLTSKEWLAEHLNIDPRLIDSVTLEEVHSGTATRSRLRIRYTRESEESGQPAAGPESLFIKSTPPGFGASLFGILFDLGGNEISFYQHARPGLPVKSPRVYYCEGDSSSYMMLLEDLADEGCSFSDLASSCSSEEAKSVVTTLANLHARFWQSERFETDLAWLSCFEATRDFRLLNLVRQLSVPIAFQKFGDVLPSSMREVVPHLLNNYQRLERQWAQEPRTLIHGDSHLGNMYFQNGQAGLLDWQVTQRGQGMRDISYFLINSLSEEQRLAQQEELISHYLATLRDLGIAMDFDTAWRQYRLHSVYAWIAGVVTAPSNFQPEKVVLAGLSRSCKAILDLAAIELIREL